jgi:energy-coupling factor transport system permease protein
MTAVTSVVSLYLSDPWALGFLFAVSAGYLLLEVKTGFIIKIYLLLALMTCLAALSVFVLYKLMPAMASSSRSINVLVPFERMAVMVNMVLAMAMKTGLAGLAKTLGSVYVPGVIRLPLIVMIRFIPTFFNDIKQLREAIRMRFRGRGGLLFWLRRPLLWCRIFFMPLIVRLIRSGDELAVASELKGLSADTKLGSEGFSLRYADIVAFGCLVLISFCSVCIQLMMKNA